MVFCLSDIASIQTGVFAKPGKEGEIIYLQTRYFDDRGKLSAILHPDLKSEDVSDQHLLKAGDVLFASKGTKNIAVLYEATNKPAVASTSFFVIRLKNKNVNPEYLVWFLNHPTTQKMLKSQAKGSSIVSISKSVLENLQIPAPDLLNQQRITTVAGLIEREVALHTEIAGLKEKQIQSILLHSTTKYTNDQDYNPKRH